MIFRFQHGVGKHVCISFDSEDMSSQRVDERIGSYCIHIASKIKTKRISKILLTGVKYR